MFGSGHTNSLRMDKPQPTSLLDIGAQNVIGKPLNRYEGPLKVSGRAFYSAEYSFPGMAYGVLVGTRQGAGRVVSIDVDAVASLPGVLDVVTDFKTFLRNPGQGGETQAPTQGVEEIAYFGQVIAIVLATSYEAARDAAIRLPVHYEDGEGRFDFAAHKHETDVPPENNTPAHFSQGNLEQAMTQAAFTLDETFTTPSQNSAAMEPHASVAMWEDDKLTLYGSYQIPTKDAMQLADALGVAKDKVRIISHFVGGGFGSKLGISPESAAAAIAARRLGRPIKAVMLRQQVFDATVRRSNTEQRIRLAADANGRLIGIGHESLVSNLPDEDYFEPAGIGTHFLYPGEHRTITHDQVRLNLLLSGSMRAPGEGSGMLALEAAMDMLAERIGIDPVELRRRNEPLVDPEKNVPFSTRSLRQCLDLGAERFGWDTRNPRPGARREGEWLVGMGMAAAARSNLLQSEEAKVRIDAGGRAIIETAMTDIGTGTYSVLSQVAGELLGLDPASIDVRMGDSDMPASGGSGGSWGACGSGSAVYLACEELRRQLAKKLGVAPEAISLRDGVASGGGRSAPLAELVGDGIEAIGTISPGKQKDAVTQASFGVHFAEVGVNAVTGEVRVRRMLGVFAAGRILNEKTARSQCLGGMTFGIGAALTEELVHDSRNGKLVNRDLAEYHVPVNADVPQLEVFFVPERDQHSNPLHAKGLGELGISGAGAAIANAVYNACGVRVRDYPLTLDKILPELPEI
ncbi:xanthine dehydrogenase family protein molybdopterin-binding subunit [Sphingosinicella sp. BN140058]|uniref:xanthine dehydrogenase family protein molybdopterin-binding subunit n=1 Tax=Sphingosinicella sp. BN140058 TaxID=1892855 RepID=UPI001012ECCC|nr:xanthine dehydrogenase family protein molybdopterin-binding subunit [Sphingosinicella sp. BN140058]QAY79553.1 xanthine dehydrogenase family protein molybdopterin-binding subunit [Sphingosinicella sp. BN140058]